MKQIVGIFLFASTLISYASENFSKILYESLDVSEVNISAAISNPILIKKISGVECTKSDFFQNPKQASYSCVFETKNLIAKELYESLDVSEENISAAISDPILRKKIYGVECTKSDFFQNPEQTNYSCSLNFNFQ